MKRREFITLLGGAAATSSVLRLQAARAQQAARETMIPTIGFLGPATAAGFVSYVDSFRQGLGATGFVEGRTVAVDYRWAQSARSPAGACRRPGRSGGRSDCHRQRHRGGACREGRDLVHSHRIRGRCRSREDWPRRQHKSAGRQYHRRDLHRQYAGRKTAAVARVERQQRHNLRRIDTGRDPGEAPGGVLAAQSFQRFCW